MKITVAVTSAVLATAALSALPQAYAADLPPVVLVSDVNPSGNSSFAPLGSINGVVLFAGSDTAHGEELWRTDGPGGATLVKDIWPGANYSTPRDGAVLNNKLYFVADSPDEGTSLWVSDGTPDGTELLIDLLPESSAGVIAHLTTFKGKVVFAAGPDEVHLDLWMTDGSAVGTKRIKDIDPLGLSDVSPTSDNQQFPILNGFLFFNVDSNSPGLWRTDLTAKGTKLVKSAPIVTQVTAVGKKLYFGLQEGDRYTLWMSDGTTPGTKFLADFGSGTEPSNFVPRGKLVLFNVRGPGLSELWRTNGTPSGTKHIVINESGSAGVGWLTVFGNRVLLRANDGTTGRELYITDGTAGGTVLVKDIAESGSGEPEGMFVKGGFAYFTGDDGIYGAEVWMTDGTTAGTTMLTDIVTGGVGSYPNNYISVNPNFIYLFATTWAFGNELHGIQLGKGRLANGSFETYPNGSDIPSKWIAKGLGEQDGQVAGAPDGNFALRLTGDGALKTVSQKRSVKGKKYDRVAVSYLVTASDLPETRTCKVTLTLRNGAQKVGTRSVPCPEGDSFTNAEQSLVMAATKAFDSITVTISLSATEGIVDWDRFSLIQ